MYPSDSEGGQDVGEIEDDEEEMDYGSIWEIEDDEEEMAVSDFAALPNEPPDFEAPSTEKVLQMRWVCNICKIHWYLDYNEACAHEEVCRGVGEMVDEPAPLEIQDNEDAPVAAAPSLYA